LPIHVSLPVQNGTGSWQQPPWLLPQFYLLLRPDSPPPVLVFRLKYYCLYFFGLISRQLAHKRITGTFGNDFLNDQVQIRTTAGIIPWACG